MNRNLVAVLVIAILLAGGAATLFFIERQPDYKPTDAIKAVPVDAALIFESSNLKELLGHFDDENKIWNDIREADHINRFAGYVSRIKEWLEAHPEAENAITGENAIVSLHVKGKQKVKPLFVTNMPDSEAATALFDVLQSSGEKNFSIKSRIYNDTRVYSLNPRQAKLPEMAFARHQGIFLLSTSSILLEEALRQLDTSISVLVADDFKKVAATAGKNNDANIYANYRKLPDFLNLLVNNYGRSFISSLRNFGGWSELDMKIRNDALLLNGFVHPSNSNSNYLQVLKKQEPVDISLHQYFPANTSSFLMLGIDDFENFREENRKYLKSKGNIHKYEHHINKVQRELKVDMEGIFHEITDEQMAAVFTDIDVPVNSNHTFAVFKVHSKKEALKRLMPMLKNFAEFKGMELNDLITEKELGDENKFLIYRMPVRKIASKLFGQIFDRTPTNFFTFYDDVLVMARSQEALVQYRQMMRQEKTMTERERYRVFSHALSSSANFYFYANVSRSIDMAQYFLPQHAATYLDDNLNVFSKFEALGLQFAGNKEMVYSNIYVKYDPETRLFQNLLWKKELAAGVKSKPVLVENHYTGAREIFVQDESNAIYLIEQSGNIFWQKQLEENIMSDIYQIDYFGNDKLQLLFNTENRIHLLDRKGRYVEDYPVELNASASNSLAVLDYKGGNDYRLAIATVDNRVLLLDKKGDPVEGWKFTEAQSEVKAPVQHIRMSNKDFICFSDQDRVYLLHRRGTERVTPNESFTPSPQNLIFTEHEDNPEKARFVTTDKDGNIKKIALDGTVSTMQTDGFDAGHHFLYEDINNSGEPDFIFSSGKKLQVFDENLEAVFSYKAENAMPHKPVIYHFSSVNKKIGIADSKAGEIILFSNDGSLYSNFPLKGQSPFSIGFLGTHDNTFKAITGTRKGLVVYELN